MVLACVVTRTAHRHSSARYTPTHYNSQIVRMFISLQSSLCIDRVNILCLVCSLNVLRTEKVKILTLAY